MKRLYRVHVLTVCLITSLLCGAVRAQQLQPSAIGISVANIDSAQRWYSERLGFMLTQRINLLDYKMKIAFLTQAGFEIELIEVEGSQSPTPAGQPVDNPAKIRGITKIAFTVDAVEPLANSLKKQKVHFVQDITISNRNHKKWFMITDPDGNWIQVLQK